jgi:hypothetical protein
VKPTEVSALKIAAVVTWLANGLVALGYGCGRGCRGASVHTSANFYQQTERRSGGRRASGKRAIRNFKPLKKRYCAYTSSDSVEKECEREHTIELSLII